VQLDGHGYVPLAVQRCNQLPLHLILPLLAGCPRCWWYTRLLLLLRPHGCWPCSYPREGWLHSTQHLLLLLLLYHQLGVAVGWQQAA
jgi:hypothetical protein